MTIITIQDLERDPVGFFRRVEAGETLVVVRDDTPIAEVKPLESGPKELRPIGLAEGQLIVPDDFDDPLPDDILDAFEGR